MNPTWTCWGRSALTAALSALALLGACAAQAESALILVYHDIAPAVAAGSPPDTVSLQAFSQQMQWLRREGYTVVSASQVLSARAGGAALPPKAVLLTFDDGLASFYTQVFPLLKALHFPATLAVVGSWHHPDSRGMVMVDDVPVRGDAFLSVEQLREMAKSGLVEFASHTYAMHRSVLANPSGGRIPAVIARAWDSTTRRYETEDAYRGRLEADLRQNAAFIKSITGVAPRLIAWPYGRYNGAALRAAVATGHVATLTLDDARGDLETMGRKYIQGDYTLADFAQYLTRRDGSTAPRRHLSLQLDALVASPPGQAVTDSLFEERLSALLESVVASQANTVLINPFTAQCEALFRDSERPVLRDILSRVVWQLHTRARVRVYLDLDVVGCLSHDQAERELLILTNASPFDGLVLRTDPQSSALTQRLADLFASEEPQRPMAGTIPFKGRLLGLWVLDACRAAEALAARGVRTVTEWVDVDARRCAAPPALDALLRHGAASWGVSVSPRFSAQPLEVSTASLLAGVLLMGR